MSHELQNTAMWVEAEALQVLGARRPLRFECDASNASCQSAWLTCSRVNELGLRPMYRESADV